MGGVADLLPLFNLLHVLENQDTTFEYISFIRRLSFSSVSRELDDSRLLPAG